MISLNNNIQSIRSATQFNGISAAIEKITQQISTGKRIVSAADDPSGVGILSNLHAQDASYNAVKKNISAGLSLLKTSSTSLDNQQKILTQMKELATSAASDLLSTSQRDALQSQFGELQKQLDNTVKSATLFGQNLTSSTAANVNIQSGINAGDTFTITAAKSDGVTLGVDSGSVDLNTAAGASAAMTAIDTAISTVAESQSTLGTQETGLQKMLEVAESTQTNLK